MRPSPASALLRRFALPLGAAALASGCASSRPPAERVLPDGAAVVRTVALCQTRVADLEARLGRPDRDGRLGARRIVSWVVVWDPLVKYVAVLANADGVVVDLYWDLPSEVAWVPTDRCVPG